MAEALVKFSLQRLRSIILQESKILSELENQTHRFISALDQIACFYDSIGRSSEKYIKFECRSFCKLRDAVHDMEDCLDEFIIQMESRNGSDQNILVDLCKNKLEMLEDSLVQITNSQLEGNKGKAIKVEDKDAETSSQAAEGNMLPSPASFKYYNINVPYYLRSCLMYFCLFPEMYPLSKRRLVRLLVAEGLVQETPGAMLEDVAENNIKSLVDLGLLYVVDETKLKVPDDVRNFILCMMEQEEFIVSCTSPETHVPPTTRRLSIHSDINNIPSNLKDLPLRSLYIFGIESISEAEFEQLRPTFQGKKLLRVLELESVQVKSIPDEVGDLIHLKYLGLEKTSIDELPKSVSKLRNLQTLDIRWNGKLKALSSGILNLANLRHLKMFNNWGIHGVIVPGGISELKNLQIITGLYAGGGVASELCKLMNLRKLGIMDLTEEHVLEVCVSVTKMKGLISLSLAAKHCYPETELPSTESLLPSISLQKICLDGCLEKLPCWMSLLENLRKLRLQDSHLSEDPTSVLQFLPNLNHLTLWRAYDAVTIGKEFCHAGGFPKLEFLIIASDFLEEWTELEEGSFPRLKYLHMHSCMKLRMLPEGLQNVTTLETLRLIPLLDDHEQRLKPDGGEENYKIANIPRVNYITNSMVQELARGHPAEQST